MRPCPLAVIAALLLFAGLACGAPEEEEDRPRYEVSDQVLTGLHEGAPWTFVAGDTDAFLSDESRFFTALYPEAFDPCEPFSAPRELPYLLLSIPTEPGEYRLGFSRNVTFVARDEEDDIVNLVATRGVLVVEAAGDTTVQAGLYARYDADHRVDGRFEVTICEDDED